MQATSMGRTILEMANACCASAQQQDPEKAQQLYEEARGYFEKAWQKNPSPDLKQRLAQFHLDYGDLLQQVGKSQHAFAEFCQARDCGHLEAQRRCSFLHVEDSKQLAEGLLREEHAQYGQLLESLADRIFKDFLSIPAEQKEEGHFVEIEQLGAPQNRDLMRRFLNALRTELNDKTLFFLYRLRVLTSFLESVNPAHLSCNDCQSILASADSLFERVPQRVGTEPELRSFLRALTHLFATLADANVRGLSQQDLQIPYHRIEQLTHHHDFEISTYAHLAVQAYLCLPHDEKKLAAVLRRELPQLLQGVFPWSRRAFSANAPSLAIVTMAMRAVDDVSNLLELFNQFREGFAEQNGQQIWYDAWRLAQLLLKTRPFADFRKFFQEEKLFRTEDRLVNGCIVTLTHYFSSSSSAFWQGEVRNFFKNLENRRPSLSEQQKQALANFHSYIETPSDSPRSCPSNVLFCKAQKTLKADSLSYWIALYREERTQKHKEWIKETQNMFYIPLLATDDSTSQGPRNDLEQEVRLFLASEKRILLLQGNAGEGKTSFTRFFEQALWKEYPEKGLPPFYLPLYNLSQSPGNCLSKTLRKEFSLTEKQIKELKERPLLFLLDGYDEIKRDHHRIRGSGLVREWPQARFLFTCRSEFLIRAHYKENFYPTTGSAFDRSQLQELYLVPFSSGQIEIYLNNHLKSQDASWSFEQYKDAMLILPNSLQNNPLFLSFLLQVLPTLSSTVSDLKKLTNAQLYDAFTEKWFERQLIKLVHQQKIKDIRQDLKDQFARFAQHLAYEMLGHGVNAIECPPQEEKNDWQADFFREGKKVVFSGCPLHKEGNRYAFHHNSLGEYFAAQKIFTSLTCPSPDFSVIKNYLFTDQVADMLQFLIERMKERCSFRDMLLDLPTKFQTASEQREEFYQANILKILGNYFQSVGPYQEAIQYQKRLLQIMQRLGDHAAEASVRISLGVTHRSLGGYQEAIKCHEEVLRIAQKLSDRSSEGRAYSNLGNVYHCLGEYQCTITYYESALQIAQELGECGEEGIVFGYLGNAYHSLGQYSRAIEYHQKALQIAQKCDNRKEEGQSYGNLGNAHQSLGQYQYAIECHEKHSQIARALVDRLGESNACGNLGNAYCSLGQYQKALTYHGEALRIAQQLGARGEESRACGNFGNVYHSLGQYQQAIEYHTKELQIAQELGARGEESSAYGHLGTAYYSLGQYQEAIECHEKALQIAQELGARGRESRPYSNLGNAYHSLGQYQLAITYHEKALQIAQELSARESEGSTYGNLGNVHHSLGQYQQAITYHEKALQIAQQLGAREKECSTFDNLGNVYHSYSQYQQAIEYHEKALQIAQEIGARGGESNAYGNLGNAYHSLGDYQLAIDYQEKKLQLAQEIGARGEESTAYGRLGNAYHSLGHYQQAIAFHEKALQIAQELGARPREGSAYSSLGDVYLCLDDHKQAIKYHNKALQIAQQLGAHGRESRPYGGIGDTLHSLGQYREALQYQEKSLQLAQARGDRGEEGKIYDNIGKIYHSLERYQQAIAFHEKALQIAQQLGARGEEGVTYGNLGTVCHSLGQYQQAINFYEKQLQIAQQLGARSGEGNAYSGLGSVYHSLGQYQESITCHEKALLIAQQLGAQKGEGRAYDDLGNAYRELAEYPTAEQCYRRSIAIYSFLQQGLTEEMEWKITIFEEQANAYFGLEEVLLRQGKELQALPVSDFRRSRALVSVLLSKLSLLRDLPASHDPLTAAEIQQLADQQNTTFLVYTLLPFRKKVEIGVWVVLPQWGIHWQLLPFTQAVGQDFEKLGKFFANFPFRNSEGGVRSLSRLESNSKAVHSDSSQRFREDLHSWYEMLISPIEEYLPDDPNQTLTIVPDGFLSQLPFAALLDPAGNYLIEQNPLVILPSLQILHSLVEHPAPRTQGALVVGNPQTTARNLPEAEREAQEIAQLLGLEADQVLIGEAASVQQVMERIQQVRWIHFACHGEAGVTPPDHPHSVFEGRLLLAPDVEHPDGSLYAHQVAQLQLDAELVYMGACSSGIGKLQGEGIVGLVWSFLAAGARATLATYWPLPDSPLTVRMVKKFYQQALGTSGEQVSKAHALQQAMQMAIEEVRDRPDLWGAFFLSGLV